MEISSIDLILLLFASNLWTGLLLIFLYWRIQQTGRKIEITNHLLTKVFDESSSSRMEDKIVQGPDLCSIELRKGEQVSIELDLGEDEPSPDVEECSIQIDFTETDGAGESEDSSDSKSRSSIVAWESRFWSDLREFGFHTELIPTDSEDDWENQA